jgi:hypothetical protein
MHNIGERLGLDVPIRDAQEAFRNHSRMARRQERIRKKHPQGFIHLLAEALQNFSALKEVMFPALSSGCSASRSVRQSLEKFSVIINLVIWPCDEETSETKTQM